jgi:catechol 2,3-dioxygenase-like lactoylglutathione lyase family enzyme
MASGAHATPGWWHDHGVDDRLTKTVSAPVTGFSHVQLLVSDVAASARWYTTVLGLEPFAADDAEGYVALRHRASGMVIVLTASTAHVGPGGPLDHLAFAVPDSDVLRAWADELTRDGIDHDGVVLELGKPSLQLRDPDGIAIELVAPAPRRSR